MKLTDYSYGVPSNYKIDEDTGKVVHVEIVTIEITIENQLFTPFTDNNGNNINLFYNVRFRDSLGQNWNEMFGVEREVPFWSVDNPGDKYGYTYNPLDKYGYMIQAYSSQYTIVKITDHPAQGQMDIQVEALEGYTNRTIVQRGIFADVVAYIFYGQESGWSNTTAIKLESTPPHISILSPQELTFTTQEVDLNFTVNEQFNQTQCSLDGMKNVTISGNTTLTGLPNGFHNVTVYAWDLAGNVGASETVKFTIAVPGISNTIETAPATVAIAIVTSVAIIGIGLIVYFKKRKRKGA